ncbi:hypothetical protein Tco_0099208 [Tanacetum coccineum]
MLRVPVTIKILVITNLHSILLVSHNSSSVVSSMEVHIIAQIVKQGIHPFMIRVLAIIKVLVMTNLHFILRISNNSSTVVRSVEVHIIALIVKPGASLSMSLLLFMRSYRENIHILEEILKTQEASSPIDVKEPEGSDDYTEVTYDKEQCLNTFLMEDEVISTIPERENDEFIKSSVDDLVPIPRESELTLDSTDLECSMPIDPPLPCTDVLGDTIVDIDLLLGEHVDTLSTGDREIDYNPSRDIEELERLLADDPVPVPRVFDEPLGNSDSMPRSYDEFEDISSLDPLESTPIIDESTLLVTPLPNPRHICLREVERFDPFFSLTQIPYAREDRRACFQSSNHSVSDQCQVSEQLGPEQKVRPQPDAPGERLGSSS